MIKLKRYLEKEIVLSEEDNLSKGGSYSEAEFAEWLKSRGVKEVAKVC